jgi:hypothetical protein
LGCEEGVLCLFQGINFIEQSGRGHAQRDGCFAGRPNVNEPLQTVLLLLEAEIVARSPGTDACGAAEPVALVADDGLDRGKKLRSGHDADGHACSPEDGFDDLAVAVARDNAAVLDRVTADDAAGRHGHVEGRVLG